MCSFKGKRQWGSENQIPRIIIIEILFAGYIWRSPAKRLLLLARTSSGKTCLSATLARKLTVEDSPSSSGSLFQCCSTCLPKLGRFCHLCMSSSSSCRLLGCSHAPPNIAQHMVYLLCSLQYWITFHL